jgi:hypothetical protein
MDRKITHQSRCNLRRASDKAIANRNIMLIASVRWDLNPILDNTIQNVRFALNQEDGHDGKTRPIICRQG